HAGLWTEFHLDAAGTVRLLLQDAGMSARQTGRMAQRLLESHTYCMMALLALPLAREVGPAVSRMERELSDIAQTPEGGGRTRRRTGAAEVPVDAGRGGREPGRAHALSLRRGPRLSHPGGAADRGAARAAHRGPTDDRRVHG